MVGRYEILYNMIKLVIFDLDGTLLDTIEDLAVSTNYALELHGFPVHPVEAYRFFVGNGISKLIERALPEKYRTADTISMVKFDFINYYFAHAEECTRPYPGIPKLLCQLNEQGIGLAVASNKVHEATLQLINNFFPDIPFTAILGQRESFPVKPNPAVLEEIIGIRGFEKEEVLYVGDSGVDVATAYNARVPFVGVLWGFRPRKELEEVGATRFVETTDELFALIHKL